MSVQSVALGSMFGWIPASFRLLGNNFRGMLMASLVTLGVIILMMIPLIVAAVVAGPGLMAANQGGGLPSGAGLTMLLIGYGVVILLMFLVFPPFLVGWFRLCQQADRGAPIRGLDILRPYADAQLWLRGIRFALLALLTYVAVTALFMLAFGAALVEYFQQAAAQQAAALAGAVSPTPVPPSGFWLAYFVMLALSMVLQVATMVGYAEISLRPTGVLEAWKLAIAGTARNGLKLLLFFLGAGIVLMLAFLLVGLLLALLIGVLSLISPTLSMVMMVLLYLPVVLLMYPLMFAGHYLVWKSMLGGEPSADAGYQEAAALAV